MNENGFRRFFNVNSILDSLIDEIILDLSLQMHWHAKATVSSLPVSQASSSSSSSKTPESTKRKYDDNIYLEGKDESHGEKVEKKGA